MKKIIRQLSLCCFAILCFAMFLAIGVKARGDETGNCTLKSVTLQINDVECAFTGDLKPYKVSEDTDWETFLKNIKVTQCSMIKDQDKCEKKVHEIEGSLKVDDTTKSFLNVNLSEEGSITNKNYEISLKDTGIDSETEFIDVVFKFGYHARDNTSEINIRFIKSYPLTYNLDGGVLPKDSITSYHSQEEVTLPTPTKEGYDFAGWTGEGILTPNKNVTIPAGTKGARGYTANWIKKQPEATTTVKKQLAVGTKVTYKKAVYKITKSTSKSAEVTLLSIKNKKAKKFTIPTKIKLSDGRKAKVTGIAKKAFNKCKKLKKIVIKSEYLKKKKIAKNAFYGLSKKAKIKVPKKKQKIYQRWFRAKKLSKKIKIYS